jgi:oligopeptide/dipeptide ABC transporter ATP-binding protein
VRRLEPTFGRLLFEGQDFTHAPEGSLEALHRRVQLVPQDFDVVLPRDASVRELLDGPLEARGTPEQQREDRTHELLDELGLGELPLDRRAQQLSLGQRQLVVTARSLALEPEVLVCDDVLSCLDIDSKERLIAAFERRRRERGVAFVVLGNDLGVVRRLARRVLVLYAGRVIERGATDQVFGAPLHPYTRVLVASEPDPDLQRKRLAVVIEGSLPSPAELPPGCPFHPRCTRFEAGVCDAETPQLSSPSGGSHSVACFHPLSDQ